MAINLEAKREELESKGAGIGINRALAPGNHVVTIHDMSIKPTKNNGYIVSMFVEGPDLTKFGFRGWAIDNNDLSKGYYKGATGWVKLQQYPYSTKTFEDGRTRDRDTSIIADLIKIAKLSGRYNEFLQGQEPDMEGVVAKAAKVFAGANINLLVAGEETLKNGYTNYYLFIPRTGKGTYAMEIPDLIPSKLEKFNPAEHIIKQNKEELNGFGPEAPLAMVDESLMAEPVLNTDLGAGDELPF